MLILRQPFDPADKIGLIEIAKLRVRSGPEESIIWQAFRPAEFDQLIVTGTAIRVPHQRFLQIFSFGTDPQICLPYIPALGGGKPIQCTIEVWVRVVSDLGEVAKWVARKGQMEINTQALIANHIFSPTNQQAELTHQNQYRSDLKQKSDDIQGINELTDFIDKQNQQLATYHQILKYYHNKGDSTPLTMSFNAAFYLHSYPDVVAAQIDPLEHYFSSGAAEGRNPTDWFDTSYYLRANPDVNVAEVNPFLHYLVFGAIEGRAPHQALEQGQQSLHRVVFDPPVAQMAAQPVEQADNWEHWEQLRQFFDVAFYLRSYPDVVAAQIDPLMHYLSSGAAEGRNPTDWFDTSYYLQTNPEVAATGINPFLHYLIYGAAEDRAPNHLFDVEPMI
jgi:hypothetical protein